jgi:hypothetical protein
MAPQPTPTVLRRYTDLPALLHYLRTGCITLLDPRTWDDRNDSHYLSVYKEKKRLRTVLALCFSEASETYHHWSVFSRGPAGVCIIFDRETLFETLNKFQGTHCARVKYLSIARARSLTLRTSELPFLKRAGYKPESEYRVIYESKTKYLPSLKIPVPVSCIRSVSLSPWLHTDLTQTTVETVRSLPGCENVKISRSTLISNEQWKAFAMNAA